MKDNDNRNSWIASGVMVVTLIGSIWWKWLSLPMWAAVCAVWYYNGKRAGEQKATLHFIEFLKQMQAAVDKIRPPKEAWESDDDE